MIWSNCQLAGQCSIMLTLTQTDQPLTKLKSNWTTQFTLTGFNLFEQDSNPLQTGLSISKFKSQKPIGLTIGENQLR